MLIQIDLNNIPLNVVISSISSVVTLLVGFKILKYQVAEIRSKFIEHKEYTRLKFKEQEAYSKSKFKEIDDKHDHFKEVITDKFHELKIDIEKILTILEKEK